METSQQNINLLKIQSNTSPVVASVFRILKNSAYVSLFILISTGIILGTLTIALKLREESVQAEQKDLSTAISSSIAKEGMIVDIRTRLSAVGELIKKQKPPIPFIDSMNVITEGLELTSLTISENNSVTVGMKLASVSEAQLVVTRIMDLVRAKTINFPILESFTVSDIDGIRLNVSYKVVI